MNPRRRRLAKARRARCRRWREYLDLKRTQIALDLHRPWPLRDAILATRP